MAAAELIDRIEAIRPALEASIAEAEATCRLSDETYDILREADLLSMLTPSDFGGLELSMSSVYDVVAYLSGVDGAIGWNLNQSLSIAGLLAWCPDALESVYASPHPVLAGALWPPAAAVEAQGGVRVSGRMPFVSGSHHAEWVVGPAIVMRGEEPVVDHATGQPDFIACVYHASDLSIDEVWDPNGMRGTGSNDAVADDVFVPDERVTRVFGAPSRPRHPAHQDPMYGLAPWHGVLLHAMVPLGISRAALQEVRELTASKVPNYFEVPLAKKPLVQSTFAEAVAGVEAAVAFVHAATDQALEHLAEHPVLPMESKVAIQLAASNAARAAERAFNAAAELAGTSAIRSGRPIERRLRDGRTILNHVAISPARFENAGQAMLGQECDWFPFNV